MDLTITEYCKQKGKNTPGCKRYTQEIASDEKKHHRIKGLKSVRRIGKMFILTIDNLAEPHNTL